MNDAHSFSEDQAVPITVLTGFLGAGKTTLLNRILHGDHGLRIAVLVNDFGSINIDADLVVGVESNGDVISLANGCVCCNIRDDLLAAVFAVMERAERPEYILLEASGVAEPSGIAATFMDARLRERIRLDSITCVVDAEQVFAHPEYPAVKQLMLRQIAYADMMILNKVDLAGVTQVAKVRAWIDDNFNRLRVVETSHCNVPLEILLSVGRFDSARLSLEGLAVANASWPDADCHHDDNRHGHDHDHDHGHLAPFSTWSYETDRPMSLAALREAARRLPGNIYRAKGVIFTMETPERPAVLQVVGRRVDVSLLAGWGGRAPRTQIVAIGVTGGVEADMLCDMFDACGAGKQGR